MNKYAAAMILIDSLSGRRFVIVERDVREAREALDVFAREVEERGIPATVYRANGAERIELPYGGRIEFATPRSDRLRGKSVDVVFIDNDAHRVLGEDMDAYDRFRADVDAALASRGGEAVYS